MLVDAPGFRGMPLKFRRITPRGQTGTGGDIPQTSCQSAPRRQSLLDDWQTRARPRYRDRSAGTGGGRGV